MADTFTPDKRSSIMKQVKGVNTAPEMIVRRTLYRMGYRFRLHRIDLPGKPDIVLPKYSAVIFVHGCFWHGHPGCPRAKRPTTRVEFWNHKLDRNIQRDAEIQQSLTSLGWRVLVIWQCQIRNIDVLETQLRQFLDPLAPAVERLL